MENAMPFALTVITHEISKTNHKFNCNDKCLIYLITCKQCLKQNVGQTIGIFRFRWNNYNSDEKNYRSENDMQKQLLRHFF